MKTLVLNGSPKAGASNTMKLTNAFLQGLGKNDIEIIDITKINIQPCKGCFA
jgi:multimeric flavodoxin WrbA